MGKFRSVCPPTPGQMLCKLPAYSHKFSCCPPADQNRLRPHSRCAIQQGRCHTVHAVNSCSLRKFRCQAFKFHFAFLTFSCTDGQHRTGSPVHGGLSEAGASSMRPHIKPARQREHRAGRLRQQPTAFVLSGLNRAFLRSCCGAPILVNSMRVRLSRKWQPGLSPGLNGKEDAAVQHHSAMSAG